MHLVRKIARQGWRALYLIRHVLTIDHCFVLEAKVRLRIRKHLQQIVTLAVDVPNQTETESNKIDLLWLLSKKVEYIFPFSSLLMFSF